MAPRKARPATRHSSTTKASAVNVASLRRQHQNFLRPANVSRLMNSPGRVGRPHRAISSPMSKLFSQMPPRTPVALVAQSNTSVHVPYLGYAQGEMLTSVPLQRVVTPTGIQIGIPIGGTSTVSAAIPLHVASGFSVAIPTAYAKISSHVAKIKIPTNHVVKAPAGYTIVVPSGPVPSVGLPHSVSIDDGVDATPATTDSKIGIAIRSRVKRPRCAESFKTTAISPVSSSSEESIQAQLDSSSVEDSVQFSAREFCPDALAGASIEPLTNSSIEFCSTSSVDTASSWKSSLATSAELRPESSSSTTMISVAVQVSPVSAIEACAIETDFTHLNSPARSDVDTWKRSSSSSSSSSRNSRSSRSSSSSSRNRSDNPTAKSAISEQSTSSASTHPFVCASELSTLKLSSSLGFDGDNELNNDLCQETFSQVKKTHISMRRVENVLTSEKYQETMKLAGKSKADERNSSRVQDLVRKAAASAALSDDAIKYLSEKGLAFAESVIETLVLYAQFMSRKATDDDLRNVLHRHYKCDINHQST